MMRILPDRLSDNYGRPRIDVAKNFDPFPLRRNEPVTDIVLIRMRSHYLKTGGLNRSEKAALHFQLRRPALLIRR
jgi:hypothetical protein